MKGINFAHTLVGTPYYLSPELWEEKPYDHKSDIWSLGWVLYELCTLKHPFTGANQAGLILRIVRGKYEPIPSFYSKDLSDVIDKCLQKDTRKRLSIQELLDLDIIKRKAKALSISIPSKDEVITNIESQKNEMITTFQRKKTEYESKIKSGEGSVKAKDKSPLSKNKDINLAQHSEAPKPKLKSAVSEKKSDHEVKVEKLEHQIQEKKKKHDDYLEKKKSVNVSNKDNVPVSYLKDPELLKNKAEPDSRLQAVKKKSKDNDSNNNVNKSEIVVDASKPSNNQKVIKAGIKHVDSDIVIEKPKKAPQSSCDLRKKSESEPQSNPRTRDPKQGSELSRQAKLAAKRGSDLWKNKPQALDKDKNQKMKDIEDVYNLPDYPKAGDSSSEEENSTSMNKSAMQLVAEYRAKQDSKASPSYSSGNIKNKKVDDILSK